MKSLINLNYHKLIVPQLEAVEQRLVEETTFGAMAFLLAIGTQVTAVVVLIISTELIHIGAYQGIVGQVIIRNWLVKTTRCAK